MTADATSHLTPEAARDLAALLAPHLRAMRSVVAGTRYASESTEAGLAISPATTIFMTGMLDRISAGTRPAVTASGGLVSRGAGIHGC